MGMRTNYKYEILTPDGFRPFLGVRVVERDTLVVSTTIGALTCSPNHKLNTTNGWVGACALAVGDLITTESAPTAVISVAPGGVQTLYDPVEVGENKAFYGNGLLNHNCEFLSSDALLISSIRLNQLRWEAPHWESMGFKFWVPEEALGGRDKIYMVSMDPATGGGGDYSTIEIFDFPGLNQIAEYRTNNVNIPILYSKLSWLLRKLTEMKPSGRAEVLWTFERNGIGEAIGALYYNDERQVEEAELVSDHASKFGMVTSGRQKVLSALQLKSLVEKVSAGGINIKSQDLIFELKHFVSKGGGYEAKAGATDDCVMGTLGIMRLLKRLSEYNEEAFAKVNEYIDPDASMDQSNEYVPFMVI